MVDAHHIVEKNISLDKTINIAKVLGKNILSNGGGIIGRVSEIRVDPDSLEIEGVLVKRSFFKKPLFIGRSYFSRLSHEAIILDIEPSILIKGRKVMVSNGKVIGKVVEVVTKGNSNDLQILVVRSLFSRKFTIPPSAIKSLGKTIMLNPKYDAKKKYFWQRSN